MMMIQRERVLFNGTQFSKYDKLSEHMLASAGAPGCRRGLDQRDDARLLPRAAAKGGGVFERDDARAAGCGVGRVVLDEQLVAALKCHVTRMLSNTHRTHST